jgi:hypothetical protein
MARLQFSLKTLVVTVTLAALLAGAIRFVWITWTRGPEPTQSLLGMLAIVALLSGLLWLAQKGSCWSRSFGGVREAPRVQSYEAFSECDRVERLIGLLRSEDRYLRFYGAQLLGMLGERAERALPDLKKALDDPDESVRIAAARALDAIRSEVSIVQS